MRVQNKSIIVTGAGNGIGEGIAKRLAQEGAQVLVNDINTTGGQRVVAEITAAGGKAAFFQADVTQSAQVQAMVAEAERLFGKLDVVVNNAGWTHRNRPMLEVSEDEFDKVYAINVKSIYLSAIHAVPALRRAGGGSIINIASTAGLRPRPGLTWYNGSKGAVITTSKSMAAELGPDNIRVNCLNPVFNPDTGLAAEFAGGPVDDTRRALTNLNGEISGRLTLATSHHIGLHRLPPLLRAFTRAHPQVALDIQFLDSEVAYEEVLHGRAELAVITLAPETRPPVAATAIWDDVLDFVAAPEHPLARNGAVSLADVARHPAVFPGDNTFTHHIVRRLFEAEGLKPNIGMSTNYLETIKMMVSIGIAWSVLPRTMLDSQVAALPLPGVQLVRRLGYIVHTERTLSNAARAFIALLEEQRH